MAELQVREMVSVVMTDKDGNEMTRQQNGETLPRMTEQPEWHTLGAATIDGHLVRVELTKGGWAHWRKHGAEGHWHQLVDLNLVVQLASVEASDVLRFTE